MEKEINAELKLKIGIKRIHRKINHEWSKKDTISLVTKILTYLEQEYTLESASELVCEMLNRNAAGCKAQFQKAQRGDALAMNKSIFIKLEKEYNPSYVDDDIDDDSNQKLKDLIDTKVKSLKKETVLVAKEEEDSCKGIPYHVLAYLNEDELIERRIRMITKIVYEAY